MSSTLFLVLPILVLFQLDGVWAQAAAWPATSYSPYFQNLFAQASAPVAAMPSGPGAQAPAIPVPGAQAPPVGFAPGAPGPGFGGPGAPGPGYGGPGVGGPAPGIPGMAPPAFGGPVGGPGAAGVPPLGRR